MIYAPIAPLPLMQVPMALLAMQNGNGSGPFVQRPAYVYWGVTQSDPDSVVLTISGEGVATIYLGAKCPQMDNCTIKAVRVEQAQ